MSDHWIVLAVSDSPEMEKFLKESRYQPSRAYPLRRMLAFTFDEKNAAVTLKNKLKQANIDSRMFRTF